MEREDAQREAVRSSEAAQSLAIPPQSLPDVRPSWGLSCHDTVPSSAAKGACPPSDIRLLPANNSLTELISLEDMLRDKRSTTTYAARPIGMTRNGVRAERYIAATIDTPANNGPLKSRNRI